MLSISLAPSVAYRAQITVPPVEGGTLAVVKYNLLQLRQTFLFGDTLFPIHFLVLTGVSLWLLVRTVRRKKVLDGLFTALAAVVFCRVVLAARADSRTAQQQP